MIVWINGAFGSGKTQAAHELRRRCPGLLRADPELPGIGLHRMLPPDLRGDFQDFPAWRDAVGQTLALPDATRIDTDHLTLDEVAEAVAHAAGLEPTLPRLGRAARRLHTLRNTLAVLHL